MKHIQKFESHSINKEVNKEVKKVNEELDLTTLTEIYNGFVQWLQTKHYAGTNDVLANWEIVAGVLAALGFVGGSIMPSYKKFSKEQKDMINKKIAEKIAENPDADPKQIAKEISQEFEEIAKEFTK